MAGRQDSTQAGAGGWGRLLQRRGKKSPDGLLEMFGQSDSEQGHCVGHFQVCGHSRWKCY